MFWNPKKEVVDMNIDTTEDLGDLFENDLTTEQEWAIFKDLAKIDGIERFLRDIMVKDMRRHFASTTEKDRDMIRGAFYRTQYFRNNIMKVLTGN